MLNSELIKSVLQDIGVIDAYQDPNPEDSNVVLSRLNSLMEDMEDDGISLGYFPQTDPSDEIPLSDKDTAAIRPLLAIALTINFPSAQPPAILAGMAQANMRRLLRNAVLANAQEASMTNLPRGTGQRWRGNIISGE